jgi:hypothetical protein
MMDWRDYAPAGVVLVIFFIGMVFGVLVGMGVAP